MKITRIEAIPLQYLPAQTFTGRTLEDVRRAALVTRIYTDAGIIGESFGGSEFRYQGKLLEAIEQHFTPALLGKDLTAVEPLWEMLFSINPDLGNRSIHSLDISNWGLVMEAIAALDNALWDALGKFYHQPVYRLLGGFRDQVPVIGVGGYQGQDIDALKDEMQWLKSQGFAGVKIAVGELSIAQDIQRVEAVRNTAGDDFIVVANASQQWTIDQAVEFCRAARSLNLRWLEEPVHWSDPYEGLRLLGDRVDVPLAAGQGEITRFGCRDMLLRGHADVLNFDATVGGGITEWRRVAALASEYHTPIAHHLGPQIGLHLLAAFPNTAHVEVFPDPTFDPFWAELPLNRPIIQNGTMQLPAEPGLGISLNPEAIEKYRVKN